MTPANAGLVRVLSNEQLIAQEKAQQLERQQASPVIVGLAAHVRSSFQAADTARQSHENDLLSALRARNGEYDPSIIAEIKKQGGSEVYMRITATKMRAAQSWLKDIFLTIERPWTVDPTPMPTLKEEIEPVVMMQLDAISRQAAAQGLVPTEEELRQLYEEMLEKAQGEVIEEAKEIAVKAERRIDDILVEGEFYKALDDCLTDITTFKVCCLKGPVIRMQRRLKWQDSPPDPATGMPGKKIPTVVREPIYKFVRVSPLALYPAPNASKAGDGFIVERHKLFRQDLVDLIGTPGFNEEAIRAVLDLYGRGGLNSWLSVDSAERAANGNPIVHDAKVSPTIDTLEYWGSVQGRMLLEWGMTPQQVPDPMGEYSCNVWVIGPYVIKAMINTDPLGRVPYAITSFVKVPGTVWGEGLNEQLKDVQQVCNAASRSLVNNMAIASGPQVSINVNRLPPGEAITSMHPWKIWQVTDDLVGTNNRPAIEFFQPQSNAQDLVAVYDKFSILADEYSSIPRYMMGDQNVQGAGRTAAGLSMLMNAANKGIKNVANNIDTDIIVPLVERLYYYLMLYDPDEGIKGDVQVRARGASGLMLKELVNQRRLEFLQLTTNPVDMQIVEPLGRAALLREIARGLEMPPDKIIPSDDDLKRRMAMQAAMAAEQAAAQPGPEEEEEYNVDYDEEGKVRGVRARNKTKPQQPKTQDQQMRAQSTGPKPQLN